MGRLKSSGIGKESQRYAAEEMTEVKTVVFYDPDRILKTEFLRRRRRKDRTRARHGSLGDREGMMLLPAMLYYEESRDSAAAELAAKL